MAKVHLMCGFMGFGKTTIAKKIAKEYAAVRLTHDEFMVALYGRDLPERDFRLAYDKVDSLIWRLAEDIVEVGCDVILDYGFWSKEKRKIAYNRALEFAESVVFHQVLCDMEIAKSRVAKRSAENPSELNIDENCFNDLYSQYSDVADDEGYCVVFYKGC